MKEGQLHQLSLTERQIKRGLSLPRYPGLYMDANYKNVEHCHATYMPATTAAKGALHPTSITLFRDYLRASKFHPLGKI